jgi:hypothetical protein
VAGMQTGIVEHHDARDLGPWESPEEPQDVIGVPGPLRREDLQTR